MVHEILSKIVLACILASSALVGCDLGDDDDDEVVTNQSTGSTGTEPADSNEAAETEAQAPTTADLVSMRDPVENCFTVSVPKGWHNRAYSARAFDIHREVVTCVSPKSDTVLFVGDPSMPQYWSPSQANDMTYQFAKVNPMMKIQDYQAASSYFPAYVKRKFGKLSGFKISAVTLNEKTTASLQKMMAQNGMQGTCEATDVTFTYTEKGKTIKAQIVGSTIDLGSFWMADVCGVSTMGNPADYLPLLSSITKSKKTNPEWTAQQAQKHEETMAQIRAFGERMTAQHERNMEWIQASAQRHQQRMKALWAQGDASMKAYYDRSAASDLQHQGFLNYINDENTVVSSSGTTYQVDNSYQRYFVNKSDGSYLGGDIRFDQDEIRRRGMNPDNYEEVKIRN